LRYYQTPFDCLRAALHYECTQLALHFHSNPCLKQLNQAIRDPTMAVMLCAQIR